MTKLCPQGSPTNPQTVEDLLDIPVPPEASMDWRARGLCAQTSPEAFFPEKGTSSRDAKRVCASCEVRAECLEYALANEERFGVWGGLSERERRKLIAARRMPAAA